MPAEPSSLDFEALTGGISVGADSATDEPSIGDEGGEFGINADLALDAELPMEDRRTALKAAIKACLAENSGGADYDEG